MFHIRSAPVLYPFCCCFISHSSFILIAFANAFHVRLILSGTVRTVPSNSKVCLCGLLNMREKQILTSVIEIQKENWVQPRIFGR